MATIKIPTAKQLANRLGGLDRLLTAKKWERAAIIWAFTTSDDKGGRPNATDPESGRFPVPVREFARLGFAGLVKPDTVTIYRQRWQEAIDSGAAPSVAPGDEIELPDMPWPPTRTGTDGDHKVESRVEKVTEYLADPEVRADERVVAVVSEVVASQQTPERRVIQVREAFEDPIVADRVMSDIHTRAQVHKATARAYDGEKVRARTHQDADPLLSRIDRFIAITKLMEVVYRFDGLIRDLPAVSEVSDEQRDELGRGAQLLAGYASALREYLATPTVDWDEALRRVNDDA